MEDAVFKKAMARRAELLEELDKIEEFLKLYRAFSEEPKPVSSWKYFADGDNVRRVRERVRPVPPTGGSETIADAAELAIKEAGRPLQRNELLEAVKKLGVDVGGKDPAATLATVVWRAKDRFVNLKGFGYWLVREPFPHAGYDPNSDSSEVKKGNLF